MKTPDASLWGMDSFIGINSFYDDLSSWPLWYFISMGAEIGENCVIFSAGYDWFQYIEGLRELWIA